MKSGDTKEPVVEYTTNTYNPATSFKTSDPACICANCDVLKEPVEPENIEEECICEYVEGVLQVEPQKPPEPPRNNNNLCFCDPPDETKLTGRNLEENMSFKSMDMFYMQNIQELVNHQKTLQAQIGNLEQKNKIYEEVLLEYKNVDFNKQQCRCTLPKDSGEASSGKTNADLKLENFLLKNELKEMRLEVRQYIERMEGPLQFKIESERYKCQQLELKLEAAAQETAKMQEFYQKEINSLKMELCTANTNIYNLNTSRDQLLIEVQEFKTKCAKLEESLILQKISEAETLKSLRASMKVAADVGAPCPKSECNLYEIARELSKLLKECEPCGDCAHLPDDLIEAARLLKSLTDLVDSKLPKSETNAGGK